ncbi:GHKL domain-containing protein [Halobacillus halophilus]|uniref:ATP-binding protein n=1 Tax=Halobacillus halophilus TaxID=1570 RepID=UPI00136F1561|nr:sensor histidine kinase [Halobacillus halophilus]MYL30920.1 GHKL domain-containing protein [Halobacillus halophilus]
MSLKRMPIRWKITILSFGMVLFSLMIGGILIVGHTVETKEEELGERALLTGQTIANLPEVRNNLQEPRGWKNIQPVVEQMRTVYQSNYIVVLNMNRIRYSHPVEDELGSLSSGRDEGPAFAEHSYTSKAKGESGTAVRGFVPVMDENHEQIGVVVVGEILPSMGEIIWAMKNEIGIVLLLTSLFGIAGSWLLARHLKEQMFALEPHEIVQLYEERTAAFEAMNEGIVTVDASGKVTLMNQKARILLHFTGLSKGKSLHNLTPGLKLDHVLTVGEPVFNREIRAGMKLLLFTSIPIKVEGRYAGAVLIFQDRTEVTRLAEELTGVKAFVDALRVQNHEHRNKLHTIAGMIQLEQNEEALQYVFDISEKQEKLSRSLLAAFQDYSIAGLLLSKIARGKELGIDVSVEEDSGLPVFPPLWDHHDMVLILGNLIENAFHAFEGIQQDEKTIRVAVLQDEETCSIIVEDNGIGMSPSISRQMYTKGFSTKGDHGSGIGLYLVKNLVDQAMGKITVKSTEGEGTTMIIDLPLIIEEGQDEQAVRNA